MKLSILIPVYNEEKTIERLLKKVNDISILDVEKEIIVIDDGSTDRTSNLIEKLHKEGKIILIKHDRNQGKGAAIRSGLNHATGDYTIIQDADLEYDPADIASLLTPIIEKKTEVVYGTRLRRLPNFKRDERTIRFFIHYIGNKMLSIITSVFYGQWITDMETGYKLIPTKVMKTLKLNSTGFEMEPEITAKLLKKRYRIYEVSISTNPRGYKEGKKLNTVKDGFRALWALIKYRFI